MRLDENERTAIVTTVRTFDPDAEIWLYGSRIHDHLKGGDIDLLIFSTKIDFSVKVSLLTELKIALGDQKLDLLIRKPNEKSTDPWVSSILNTALKL